MPSSLFHPGFTVRLAACLIGLVVFEVAITSSASAWQPDDNQVQEQFSEQDLTFFENRIRPLLVEHCLECHGAKKEKVRGGLWLNSRQQMLVGGDSGPAIVPGKPDESLLISVVHYEDFEMPPKGQLSKQQINDLEKWIADGAADPRTTDSVPVKNEIDIEQGKKFWAFQAPTTTSPPTNDNDSWSISDVDSFILQRLKQSQIQPNKDANRFILLRRVHLALTGLPPTEQQIERFTKSQRSIEEDLAEVVDQLLASPHFGQRWGRHWLDVARFAESSGGGRSLMFPNAWRYRDYVIDSFNRDKPFDQLIMEQIAGDLLPFENQEQRNEQVVATGFLALGPTNYEQQDKELLRMEVIDEQVDTVGRALLGMTLGCARCHDHKFDPIPTRDYYAMAGIFGSTVSLVNSNVSAPVTTPLADEKTQKAFADYQSSLKRLNEQRKKLEQKIAKLGGKPVSNRSVQKIVQSKQLRGVVVDNLKAELIGKWKESISIKAYVDQGYIHDLGQPKGKNKAIFRPELESGGIYEVRLAYSHGANRASNTKVTIDHQDGQETVFVNQSKVPDIEQLYVSLGSFRFEANNLAEVTISNEDADGIVIADAIQFLMQGAEKKSEAGKGETKKTMNSKAAPKSVEAKENSELKDAKAEFKRVEQAIRRLKKDAPKQLTRAMSVKDASKPADGHVHIRGNIRQLGEKVPRGFLEVVTPRSSWPEIESGQSGRLQLAHWIADESNPLTARVYVNRIWRHLFGKGLVESTDNFGDMGTRPSHPELLDYLAKRFVDQGWSTKKLIRKIVLSRVFRLSSQMDEQSIAVDPENKLLWRTNRRRMDAEVLRDAILFASGNLDLKQGGLTIRKITQYDLGYQFDSNRRSVYVPAFRNSMLDLFEVFDIANPNMVTGHRNTSTLPTQALFLMNSPWVIDQAKAMSEVILDEAQQDEERLNLIYLRMLGRKPSKAERELSMEYLSQFNDDQAERWQRLIHTLFASLDFRYIN